MQAWMLSSKLKLKFGKLGLVDEVGKIFAASAVMTLASLGLRAAGAGFFQGKGLALFSCAAAIPIAACVYFACLALFKSKLANVALAAIIKKK